MKNTNSFRLKSPIVVWLLGCCYILSGPSHIFQILVLGHDPDWYRPLRWVQIFTEMSFVDQAICVVIPLAGIGLLMQRKRTWALAVAGLMLAFFQNIYCIYAGVDLLYPIEIPMIGNAAVLVVLYYFRYPYLDRRDRILTGYTRRYPVNIPIKYENQDVVITSVSAFGCSLQFAAKMKLPEVHSDIQFEVLGMSFEGHVRYHHEKNIGIRFVTPRRLSRSKMRQLVNASGSVRKAS